MGDIFTRQNYNNRLLQVSYHFLVSMHENNILMCLMVIFKNTNAYLTISIELINQFNYFMFFKKIQSRVRGQTLTS